MPVALEFINVLIRRDAIEQKIQGGWRQFTDGSNSPGGIRWHDDYLFRTGAMSPAVVEDIVRSFTELGLSDTKIVNGEEHWDDLCVFENMFGASLRCDWLDYDYWLDDRSRRAVRFLGDHSEVVVGLDNWDRETAG